MRVSRAEVTKIIMRLFNLGSIEYQSIFADAHSTDCFYTYVSYATKHGLIDGYLREDGPNMFQPNTYITRAEFSKLATLANLIQD